MAPQKIVSSPGAPDQGDLEILGNDGMAGYIGKNHIRYRYDQHKPYGKPVEAVGQVNGIGRPDQHKNNKRPVQQPEIGQHPLEKRQAQMRIDAGLQAQIRSNGRRHEQLQARLLPRRDAL